MTQLFSPSELRELGIECADFVQCKLCQAPQPVRLEAPASGPHYAKRVCSHCGRIDTNNPWVRKPGGEKKRRPPAARRLVHRYSAGYCEMCCRREEELPPGQQLEAHHVIPFSADEAHKLGFDKPGADTRENTWILCTACHLRVDFERTYTCQHYRKLLETIAEDDAA